MITTFGVGAIVDLPKESVIIAGTDYWKDYEKYRINENSLQKLLQVDYFVTPPGAKDEYGNPTDMGVPAFLFPTWMLCSKCKRLASAKKFGFTGYPRCEKCKVPLVPSRFVVACENGHLDDFPYEWWVHYGGRCKKKNQPELSIEMSDQKSGLDGIKIICKSCGSERTMMGSFGVEALKGFKCTRRRPWLKDIDPGECDQTMRTMQRGATNLHFGVTVSALSIPPWSKNIMIKINENWRNLKPFLDNKEIFTTLVSGWKWPEKLGCTADEIWEHALRKQENDDNCDPKTWQDILEDEYGAFLAGSTDEEGEFKTKTVEVPPIAAGYVDKVVLALRLREVMALQGFTRIRSDYDMEDKDTFVKLSRDFKNWLPGVELKGEGIFIKLNEERLTRWENEEEIIDRYKHITERKVLGMGKRRSITPRYILLHTLAHLLIRQLTLQCGYASASIKERIYCSFTDSEKFKEMAGILIYTSANDSEGSLGGLVREGMTDRLDNTIRQMLEAASWCSSDPLCINSKGQGTDATNLAACHSCALLPETSCEIRNCYLDRAAVIGTFDNTVLGYFGPLLTAGESERR